MAQKPLLGIDLVTTGTDPIFSFRVHEIAYFKLMRILKAAGNTTSIEDFIRDEVVFFLGASSCKSGTRTSRKPRVHEANANAYYQLNIRLPSQALALVRRLAESNATSTTSILSTIIAKRARTLHNMDLKDTDFRMADDARKSPGRPYRMICCPHCSNMIDPRTLTKDGTTP